MWMSRTDTNGIAVVSKDLGDSEVADDNVLLFLDETIARQSGSTLHCGDVLTLRIPRGWRWHPCQ